MTVGRRSSLTFLCGSSKRTPEERFDASYIPEPNSGCWLWLGGNKRSGLISVNKKLVTAYRYSYMRFKGKIPNGMLVCHSCDIPCCVNPDHLWLGTHKENTADMIRKNRHGGKTMPERSARGERSGTSKVTEKQVLEIFNSKGTYAEIGRKYNINYQSVRNIQSGKTWSWLTNKGENNE